MIMFGDRFWYTNLFIQFTNFEIQSFNENYPLSTIENNQHKLQLKLHLLIGQLFLVLSKTIPRQFIT